MDRHIGPVAIVTPLSARLVEIEVLEHGVPGDVLEGDLGPEAARAVDLVHDGHEAAVGQQDVVLTVHLTAGTALLLAEELTVHRLLYLKHEAVGRLLLQ